MKNKKFLTLPGLELKTVASRYTDWAIAAPIRVNKIQNVVKLVYYVIELLTFWTLSIVLRDSSVGIATGYGLDDQGEREFESR
jgi:hypothetical protein